MGMKASLAFPCGRTVASRFGFSSATSVRMGLDVISTLWRVDELGLWFVVVTLL
jgi:hypothetical protein